MPGYHTTWDALAETIGAAKGSSSGSITDLGHLTIDQQLQALTISALLSINEELSAIRHMGINPEFNARD